MAEQLGIPAPFLGKVLQPLVTRGYLHSQRGRSGGFRLDRPAAHIYLVQIAEAEETLRAPNVCLLGQHDCDDAHACPLHDMWMKASRSFRERLERTSLQDMVDHGEHNPGSAYPFPNLALPTSVTPRSTMPANRAVPA